MEVTPLAITSDEPLANFLLPVPRTLCSASRRGLSSEGGTLLPGDATMTPLTHQCFSLLSCPESASPWRAPIALPSTFPPRGQGSEQMRQVKPLAEAATETQGEGGTGKKPQEWGWGK